MPVPSSFVAVLVLFRFFCCCELIVDLLVCCRFQSNRNLIMDFESKESNRVLIWCPTLNAPRRMNLCRGGAHDWFTFFCTWSRDRQKHNTRSYFRTYNGESFESITKFFQQTNQPRRSEAATTFCYADSTLLCIASATVVIDHKSFPLTINIANTICYPV